LELEASDDVVEVVDERRKRRGRESIGLLVAADVVPTLRSAEVAEELGKLGEMYVMDLRNKRSAAVDVSCRSAISSLHS
jgi:hypothetical protein